MFILTRYFYGDKIKDVEMCDRSDTHWGREIYRENYI